MRAGKVGTASGEPPASREEATPPPPPGIVPGMGSITPPLSLPPPSAMSPGASGHFPGSPFGGVPPHSDAAATTTTIPPDMMPSPPATGGRKRGPGRPRAGSSAVANEMAAGGMAMGMGPMGIMDPACAGAPGMMGAAATAVMGPDGKGGKGGSAAANKKRYVCEICQKRFSTAWYVRVHRKSHNGERPYICHNCGKGFMLPNVLQVHLRKCEKTAPVAGASATSGVGAGGPSMPPGADLGHGALPEQMRAVAPPSSSDVEQRPPPSSSLPRPPVPPHPMPPIPTGFPPSDHMGPMPFGRGSPMGPLTGAGGPGDMANFNQRFSHGGYPPPLPPPHAHPQTAAQHMGDQQQPMGLPPPFLHHGAYDMQQQQQPVPPQQHSICESPGPLPPGLYSPGQMSHHPPPQNHRRLDHHPHTQQHHQPHQEQEQQQQTPPASSTGSSGECAPSVSRSSPSPGHFLGNDRPRDKGGGGGENASGGSDSGSTKGASPDLYCSTCEIQFEEKLPLEEHLKSHRPYSCEVCDKRFSQKCNLITHMRLHTGEKPYTCSFCEKRFTQKGNLDAHLKTHTKEKPYPCPHPRCDKKFSFKSSMLSHVKQNHGGNLPPLPPAPQHQHGGGGGGALERNPFEYDEDDITSIKQQIKFASTSAPDFPVSPNNFSSGIPTPQSSLDSMPGGCAQQHPIPPPGYPYGPSQPAASATPGGASGAILPPGGPYLAHPDAPSTPHSRSTPETPVAIGGGIGGGGADPSVPQQPSGTGPTTTAAAEQSNISKLAQAVQSVTAAAAVSSRISASESGDEGGGGTVGRQTLAIS